MAFAFGHTFFYSDSGVECARFFEQRAGFVLTSGVLEKKGKGTDGVGEVERAGVWVTAVDGKGLSVERLGNIEPSGIRVDVGDVADGVREMERLGGCAVDGRGFRVVLEGEVKVAEVTLDLAAGGECGSELRGLRRLARQRDGLVEVSTGIVETEFTACLSGLGEEVGNSRHGEALYSRVEGSATGLESFAWQESC